MLLITLFIDVEKETLEINTEKLKELDLEVVSAICVPNLIGNIANWEAIYNFAKENRALGLGVLGWHSLLQSKKLSFNSQDAFNLNNEVFKFIHKRSYKASEELANKFGEPEVLKGYGRRNTTLNAVAPTTSSAFILGQVSQGIEPIWSNIYVKDIAKVKTTIRNPFLVELLEEKGKNTKDVWKSIISSRGSVEALTFLTPQEKNVFKTAIEIDQAWLVDLAAERQKYICQAQSLNLFFPPDVNVRRLNNIHKRAWDKGLKTLYYCRSEAIKRAENISNKVERKVRQDSIEEESCVMCQA